MTDPQLNKLMKMLNETNSRLGEIAMAIRQEIRNLGTWVFIGACIIVLSVLLNGLMVAG